MKIKGCTITGTAMVRASYRVQSGMVQEDDYTKGVSVDGRKIESIVADAILGELSDDDLKEVYLSCEAPCRVEIVITPLGGLAVQ